MKSHTASLFNAGPVKRILDLAVKAQESSGTIVLEDELRRFIRAVENDSSAQWACPIHTATALLDLAGDTIDSGAIESMPPDFQTTISRAAEGMDCGEYLHTLAGVIRLLDKEGAPDYTELPMSRWEMRVRFPGLKGFGVNWIYDGDYSSLAESTAAAIASEHPLCNEFLSSLAAEAQAALALSPNPRSMQLALAREIEWVSSSSLRELVNRINAHMLEEHGHCP
ncbi:hypothetical protein [Streptomyces sp. NPDC088141]|uniref:hypothetical protein n=1 Tax=Streptomyces sp. NPDC088141 TaxID=3155179 RepID=UPI0034364654